MTEGSPLAALGWTAELGEQFETYAADGLVPGRVVAEHRAGHVVRDGVDEVLARPRGRLYDDAAVGGLLPAVGDWVARVGATIEAVLPRRTSISRKIAFRSAEEQVLAANVDVVLIVTGLDGDFNVRRLERYLTTAWNSGASPVIVLTKLDLAADPDLLAAEEVAMGVPVLAVSGITGEGVDALDEHLRPGLTAVLLGSSGVGKSTLINRLLGEERIATAAVKRDGRGRHTTRHRELFGLPGGALVIDTPGLRELQLWEGDVDEAFSDVVELAAQCRFRDCAHESEPGCAVREGVDPERLQAYRKLQRELRAIEARSNRRVHRQLKQRWKQRARESRRARRY